MRIAYFSDYQLLGQGSEWNLVAGAAAHHRPSPGQALPQSPEWQDELTRHQAIYEELLASPEWAVARKRPAPTQRTFSARELTRDLAGWAPPQPGALRTGKSLLA